MNKTAYYRYLELNYNYSNSLGVSSLEELVLPKSEALLIIVAHFAAEGSADNQVTQGRKGERRQRRWPLLTRKEEGLISEGTYEACSRRCKTSESLHLARNARSFQKDPSGALPRLQRGWSPRHVTLQAASLDRLPLRSGEQSPTSPAPRHFPGHRGRAL